MSIVSRHFIQDNNKFMFFSTAGDFRIVCDVMRDERYTICMQKSSPSHPHQLANHIHSSTKQMPGTQPHLPLEVMIFARVPAVVSVNCKTTANVSVSMKSSQRSHCDRVAIS
jgi:hypothetical protein